MTDENATDIERERKVAEDIAAILRAFAQEMDDEDEDDFE
jgi:hypothetical protein